MRQRLPAASAWEDLAALDFVGRDVAAYLDKNAIPRKVWKAENLAELGSRSARAISLILREKEIILFSLLQWVAIALAYYLWVQILGWIPEEVWNSPSKLEDTALNVAVLAWSVACVALAAYPIGVLTGAMGAAHFLREQHQPSTIAACLKLAWPNSTRLWMFHALDGWLTVDIILERMPKKGHFNSGAVARRAVAEAIYYAWKVGTIAMPPAILAGRGLVEAGRESIALVKSKPWQVVKLRGGYSAICWIIGVATYVGALVFLIAFPLPGGAGHSVLSFYVWLGLPILAAVGVIKLFVRPVYVIASCQLYSEFLKESGKSVSLGSRPGRGTNALVAFVVLCAIVLAVSLYREEIGLMALLAAGS